MAATESFCSLAGIDTRHYSKKELILLEAELFICICRELKEIFKTQYRDYFHLMKYTVEMENAMLDSDFIRYVMNDILSTEEYTLAGIAYYTQMPLDVIYEIAVGRNLNPSAAFLRKIIELHRSVKRDLYRKIIQKVRIQWQILDLY